MPISSPTGHFVRIQSVSMSTDTTVNGIDGLNVKWDVPFKFDDYLVGFRYSLSELRKAPESLFAKRSFNVADSDLDIDADFNVRDKSVNLAGRWVSDKLGLAVSALADSKDYLTEVGAETKQKWNDMNVIAAKYDLGNKHTNVKTTLSRDETSAAVSYNTNDKDVLLEVSHDLDSSNTVSPSISLTSGDVTYGWTRKWNGGSLKSTYHPGDKASFKWTDEGTSGTWSTTADVPLENTGNTKVTFSRDWNY